MSLSTFFSLNRDNYITVAAILIVVVDLDDLVAGLQLSGVYLDDQSVPSSNLAYSPSVSSRIACTLGSFGSARRRSPRAPKNFVSR